MEPAVLREWLSWNVLSTVEKWDPTTIRSIQGDLRLDTDDLSSAELSRICGPDSVLEVVENRIINFGINAILSLLVGYSAGALPYSNTNSRLGVGNGDTGSGAAAVADTATDTGLTTTVSSGRYYKGMETNFPPSTGPAAQSISWKSSYGTGVANFAWDEWSLDNDMVSSGNGTTPPGNTGQRWALNHKGGNANPWLGTKLAGSTWTLTVSVTLV